MKVLRIEHNSFSKTLNNGKTGEDLFSFIPKECRYQLFFTPQGELDDLEYAASSFLITDRDILHSLRKRTKTCGRIISTEGSVNLNITTKGTKSWYKNRWFRDLLWGMGSWKTHELLGWCKQIAPDIILIGGSSQTFPFAIARYLSKKMSIPTAIYCGDDYIAYYSPTSIWDKIQKLRLKSVYKHFCRKCTLCMAISQAMSESFSALLGVPFITMPRPVDIPEPTPVLEKEKPVVSYFGGLGLNRWRMIARLARLTKEAEFRVYSLTQLNNEIKMAFKSSGVVFMGGVSGKELRDAIIESDVLLHVESDDKEMSSFTRLAVSTKIPEYLSYHRFVLGYGPSYIASMKVLSDNNIGVILDSRKEEELQEKLLSILTDVEYRRGYADRGFQYAKNNYSKSLVANRFAAELKKATVIKK